MTKAANDNEPNPWSTIGLQAALIVNRLRCQAQLIELQTDKPQDGKPEGSGNIETSDDDKKRADDERCYVEHRLKTIASWERKIRGGKM